MLMAETLFPTMREDLFTPPSHGPVSELIWLR